MTNPVTMLAGDVFDVLPTLQAGSVDCVVTSPPYWMLRSYLPKGHPLKHLELGSEPTPAEYVGSLVRVFRLVREAVADHGTVWLNVGDSYSGGTTHFNDGLGALGSRYRGGGKKLGPKPERSPPPGISAGNLCLIPQRLAIALQDDGWLVRSVVVWHKKAPMPSSVAGWRWQRCRVKVKDGGRGGNGRTRMLANETPANVSAQAVAEWSDCPGCKKCEPHGGYVLRKGSWRPTSSWEPILMLAKSSSYFCDGEAVKTPAAAATIGRDKYTRVIDDPDEQFAVKHDHETLCDSGANLRDVWTIAAEPLKEKHYAAFPTKLVENCLRAGTSAKGYCPGCGAPWVRVVEGGEPKRDWRETDTPRTMPNGNSVRSEGVPSNVQDQSRPTSTVGWRPSCRCPDHEPRPALVLDPFAGSGRTGITARRLGLHFVGVELNSEYADMATRLLVADAPLFNQ